jgi:class 3 adenylate cyclase
MCPQSALPAHGPGCGKLGFFATTRDPRDSCRAEIGARVIHPVEYVGMFPEIPINASILKLRKLRSKGPAIAKAVFNIDYAFPMRFAPILFGIAAPAEFLYYWFETSHGYWDNLQLRSILCALLVSLAFIDRKKSQRAGIILYWEFVLAMVFPFQSTMALLQNHVNDYYTSSQIAMFIFMGMMTKVWMIPVHMVVGCGLTTVLYSYMHGWDGTLIAHSVTVQVNALFSGIVSASVLAVMESYHRRITEAKVALAKADEEKAQAAEIAKAYSDLKQSEELIRRYVRPSLVEEIRSGKDPSLFEPVLRDLAIMFCDIRGFTKLTETLNPYERQVFLNQYFSMMTRPIVAAGGEVDKIMGDCVMSVFPDGATAVAAAIAMRLELQKFNRDMFAAGSPMIRNGIGIAKGEVMLGNFGSYEKLDRTVVGEAVNIASRLESKTKMYNIEVVVTEDIIKDLKTGTPHYRWIDIVQVKGSTRHLKLYEIYGHQPEDVRQFKDETRDLFEKALTIYFQKGFKDASRLFRAMLERVPPHRLLPDQMMDNILQYYIGHCDAWINNPNGTWEEIQRWGGVHIFTEK